ncbi:hypothetical protein D3C71_90350 [compost metagenome]
MAKIYEIENRVLVPNWRDFKRTVLIGELADNNKPIRKPIDNSIVKRDWQNSKTIGVAADLISSSFISNDMFSEELQEAIKYVEANKFEASIPLLSLIDKIKSENNPSGENSNMILEMSIKSAEEFRAFVDSSVIDKMVSKTRNLTKEYTSNAIYWVELARLYTIKNQNIKAEKCIRVALNLAPDNRFVLRSAVRFFTHIHEEEKAIYYLKKSKSIKEDPWLISAHIATSKLINRYSPFIKNGIDLITSKKFSDFELTELASSVGSLELENGSFKRSKPYLDLSIANPNDNSLAQFEWLRKKESKLILKANLFNEVKNPFEAFTYENYKNGNFKDSIKNCINWFLDVPYSKRPLMFGSYLAALIGDFDLSIFLCLVGLKSNKREVGFINNIVYAYCLKNELSQVPQYLSLIDKNIIEELSVEEFIMLQATIGLYNIRQNNIEEGKRFYEIALSNSHNRKIKYSYDLALINYTRELFLIKDIEFNKRFEEMNDIESVEIDILANKQQVMDLINKSY